MPGAIFDPLLSQLRTTDQAIFDGRYVLKAGDTITGLLSSTFSSAVGYNQVRAGSTVAWGNGGAANFIAAINGNVRLNLTDVGMSLLTGDPTHTLTLPSTATGIALYNTVDQVTNFERLRINNQSNIFTYAMETGGTGTGRDLAFTTGTTSMVLSFGQPLLGVFQLTKTLNAASRDHTVISGGVSTSSGTTALLRVSPTITQSGTAGYTALLVNPTETSTGSGAKLLADFQVGGVNRMSLDNMGNLTMADLVTGGNINTGTTNGTMIGTTTAQRLGFFGATPIVQPVNFLELGTVLSNLGLRAAGAVYSLNTSGTAAFSGPIREETTTLTASTALATSSRKNIRLTASAAAINITLPATTLAGYQFRFYRTDATAQVVTILGTINGNAGGYNLSAQYKYVEVVSTTVSGVWEIWSNN